VVETHFRGAFKLGVYGERWKLFHNRDQYPNLNPVELQRVGSAENGVLTDEAELYPEIVHQMAAYLSRWETEHPPGEPVEVGDGLSQEMLEQLRSLGYLE
jgi:hypothetical protein